MNKRTKLIIIILLAIIVIAVIAGYLYYNNKKQNLEALIALQEKQEQFDKAPGQAVEIKGEVVKVVQTEISDEQVQNASIKTVARTFSERFGTYTNHSKFESIKDLVPMMTNSMSSWVEDFYIPGLVEQYPIDEGFYRIVSRVPVANIVEQTASSSTVLLSTERTETVGGEDVVYNQDLTLEMVKQGESWLVDGAYWEKLVK
jgi:hypothetical protein